VLAGLPEGIADRSALHEVEGDRLWVGDFGPEGAPVVVLLHGLLTTGIDWSPVIARLGTERRVIAPDLPGCGSSDRPPPEAARGYAVEWIASRLGRLLQEFELGDFVLAGHDFGATVAIALLGREGLSIRRGVLVAPLLDGMNPGVRLPNPFPRMRRLWKRIGVGGPLALRTLFTRRDLRRYLERRRAGMGAPESALVDVYWDRLCRDGGLEAAGSMLERIEELHGVSEQLLTLDVSLALAWGEHDSIAPVERGRSLSRRANEQRRPLRLEVFPGCGHSPHRERVDEIAAMLLGDDSLRSASH
jgi:pimeloyl-ACP methyl ester carboxylesterase